MLDGIPFDQLLDGLSAITVPSQEKTRMSTTALFSGSRTYFFSGDQYIRVTRGDTGPGTLDPGYPKNLSVWNFPGAFGQNGIDAALHSGSRTYFFSGDQYIRVTRGDTGAGTLDPGYPKNISVWHFPGAFGQNGTATLNVPGIDAVLYSGSKTYFFSGDQYIRATRGDTGAGTLDPGYPKNISGWQFPGAFGRNGIDAALHSGSKTYFFSGDQYIRVTRGDTGPGTLDPGYPRSFSAWNWPAAFETSWTRIAGNFAFDPAITTQQRTTLLERHRFAFGQVQACGSLTNDQKTALTQAYRRPIRNGINTTAGVNASAFINGNQVFVNFDVLFPQGNNEIAQTLIHEMMHCAGFTHPLRSPGDTPGDGGPYYGTPPLQAELCIAGVQSDVVCVAGPDGECTIVNRQP